MALYLIALVLGCSLVFGQVSPGSMINSSSPCIAQMGNYIYLDDHFGYVQYSTLYTQADIDAIVNCTAFKGIIFIDPTFKGDVLLPNLESLNGVRATSDNITEGNLTGLIFPNLQNVLFDNAPSSYISIFVANISSIQTIWLPNLYNYSENLVFSNLSGLTNLSSFEELLISRTYSVPEVEAVNNFEISYTSLSSFYMVTFLMRSMRFIGNPKLVNFTLNASKVTNLTVSATNIVIDDIQGNGLVGDNLDLFDCQTYQANLVSVGGSFSLHDTSVSNTSVTLPVSGDFIIVDNAELTTLTLTPSWPEDDDNTTSFTNIGGDFNISNCPKIMELSLEGTDIKNISGSLNITNNYDLARVSLLDLTSIGGSVLISNSDALANISLPNLESIGGSVLISDLEALASISLPNLKTIGGSILISNSSALASISLPNLKTIGGSILISNSSALASISLPNLETIGGDFNITNNPQLSIVAGFPKLRIITGTLYFEGNFASIELPLLQQQYNGFVIKSTNPALDCSQFDHLRSLEIIRNPYSCTKTSTKKSLTEGAKAGVGVGVSLAVIASLIALMYLKRRQSKEKSGTPLRKEHGDTSELPQGKHYEKAEAPAISKPGELDGVVPVVASSIIRKPVPGTVIEQENETERHELQ